MLVGYARVSTQEQDLALQLDALKTAGCSKVFEEKASGAQRERPALQATLEYMREGDTLVVWRLDRLARSLKQLIETVEGFGARDVGLRSLTEAIDTTTAGGKLVFHIFAALAEFERGVIRERTLAGLQAARACGQVAGLLPSRPRIWPRPGLCCSIPRSPWSRSPSAWVWRPRLSTAICRGRGPRPWKPEPEQPMPIKPELRYFYPIDWPQISHWVRFVRAKGHCQVCGRPHGETVQHLGDGRWWDETEQTWRDGRGRKVPSPAPDVPLRTTKVVLAAAHLDHDPAHCGRRHRNVRALCQRCHMLHDRPEHRRRIRMTLRRRRALGDLFSGPYPSW